MDVPAPKHLTLEDAAGNVTVLEIPATSGWHELLPQHQVCAIRPLATPEEPART